MLTGEYAPGASDTLDTRYSICSVEDPLRLSSTLKKYMDEGHLGRKSGRGFYAYPGPAYEQPEFVRGE